MDPIEALIQQAQARDAPLARRQEAFGALVERFQDLAYGYAHALLGDPHLAQDAAQEAFLTAYRRLEQLRTPAAFAGWLRRIVRTQCVRLRRGKEPPPVPFETLPGLGAGANASLRGQDPGVDPATLAESRELRAIVATALQALPARERVVTVLFYLSDYPQQEIADFLGVPVTTVKKRLQSARKRLQESMLVMMDDALREYGPEHRPSRDDRFMESVRFLANFDAAAAEGELPLVELLLVDGLDVNARDADGRTLLSWAAQRGHPDAAEFLLRHGADVNARDQGSRPRHGSEGPGGSRPRHGSEGPGGGTTPLGWAERAGHPAVAALLRGHGGVR